MAGKTDCIFLGLRVLQVVDRVVCSLSFTCWADGSALGWSKMKLIQPQQCLCGWQNILKGWSYGTRVKSSASYKWDCLQSQHILVGWQNIVMGGYYEYRLRGNEGNLSSIGVGGRTYWRWSYGTEVGRPRSRVGWRSCWQTSTSWRTVWEVVVGLVWGSSWVRWRTGGRSRC